MAQQTLTPAKNKEPRRLSAEETKRALLGEGLGFSWIGNIAIAVHKYDMRPDELNKKIKRYFGRYVELDGGVSPNDRQSMQFDFYYIY